MLLVNVFCVTSFRTFSTTPYLPLLVGSISELKWRQLGIDPVTMLVGIRSHTVQIKPMIKAHFSGRMASSGISDVAIISVHSEKTCLKKLMKMIIFIMNKARFLAVAIN